MLSARGRSILGTVLAAVLAAMFVVASPAYARSKVHRIPRYYTATINPDDAAPGADASFVFRITESAGSKGRIGSANIDVPAGFTINDPGTVETFDMNGAPTARSWTSTLSGTGTTIQLRTPGSGSQKLLPTEYLEVIFDAQVTCTAGTYAWKSAARATNDFHNNGINFVIANSQPVPTVGVASSC